MNDERTNWELGDAVEIELPDTDKFLLIKETLQRIGIASYKDKRLFQTAHILHKRGRYYILHFKCLFALDGKNAPFDTVDWKRQNRIAQLLGQWGLCTLVEPLDDDNVSGENLKVLRHSEKAEWELVPKYNIGV